MSKTVKEGAQWHKRVFVIGTAYLYMDGYYADEKTKVPDGVTKYYRTKESITDSCLYRNGRLKAKYTFYANGRQKNYILFTDSAQVTGQGGYTEDGNRINNYIVWQPAMYEDDITGWRKYLNKKINRRQPRGYTSGLMEGTVEITFEIDTTGNITNAKISKKSGFIDLDQRALAIIEKSPRWIPAIVDNQPVSSVRKETISFANNEVNAQASKTFDTGIDFFRFIAGF